MTCFEFRRYYLAEPRSKEAEFLRHKRTCRVCAAYVAEQSKFENALERALHVDVPPELSARLILNQATVQARTLSFVALAAGVVLTLSVLAGWWMWPFSVSLDQAVIAHLYDDPEPLRARNSVSAIKVADTLQTLGVGLKGNLGEVRYAGICQIGRHWGAHFVLAGANGPVTVLLLPDDAIKQRRFLDHGGFHGVLAPTRAGAMAIIGERGEVLTDIERRLQAAVYRNALTQT